jgi:hypothetical protein
MSSYFITTEASPTFVRITVLDDFREELLEILTLELQLIRQNKNVHLFLFDFRNSRRAEHYAQQFFAMDDSSQMISHHWDAKTALLMNHNDPVRDSLSRWARMAGYKMETFTDYHQAVMWLQSE